MSVPYTLVGVVECNPVACVDGNHHKIDCQVQKLLPIQVTNSAGYLLVSLGHFNLTPEQIQNIRKDSPYAAPFSKFTVTLQAPITTTKKQEKSSVLVSVKLCDYGLVAIGYTVEELEPYTGTYHSNKRPTMEISRRRPDQKKISFEGGDVTVSELRIVNMADRNQGMVVNGVVSYPTVWRVELIETPDGFLINKKRPDMATLPRPTPQPRVRRERHAAHCPCSPGSGGLRSAHWICGVLFFALVVLIAVLVYVVYQYLENETDMLLKERMVEAIRAEMKNRKATAAAGQGGGV